MTMKQKTGTTAHLQEKKSPLHFLRKNLIGWLLLLPSVFCIYFFSIRPKITGMFWSFFNMKGYKVLDFVGFENYKRVFSDTLFLKILSNTFQYTIWSLIIGFMVPIILALFLSEMRKFRDGFRFFTYLPSVLPGVAAMMLWYYDNTSNDKCSHHCDNTDRNTKQSTEQS